MPDRERSGSGSAVVAWWLLLALACSCGCGGDRPKTIPVSGKITFSGGPCPAEGWIDFQPVEVAPGYPTKPGSASFGKDGTFSVTSYETDDGLVPGRYRVHIECWQEMPDEATMSPGVSHVPEGYQPAELIVEPTARGEIRRDVDVPAE